MIELMIQGYAVYADPPNACSGLQPTPNVSSSVNWILIARRYDCDFQTKIENAQNMGNLNAACKCIKFKCSVDFPDV